MVQSAIVHGSANHVIMDKVNWILHLDILVFESLKQQDFAFTGLVMPLYCYHDFTN